MRVKHLVQEGMPLNKFDDLGKTPLHYATEKGHIDVMKLLTQSGADVNAHDESKIGNTPLSEVAGECSFEIAKVLIEAGADPTIKGWMQLNALDRAKNRKRNDGPKVYQLLLKTAGTSCK